MPIRSRRDMYVTGHGRHNGDTELGFYRGYAAGYKKGWADKRRSRRFNDDPSRSRAFIYGEDVAGEQADAMKPDGGA